MWPELSLTEVPDTDVAVELADKVRCAVFGESVSDDLACDLHEVCRQGGFVPRRVDCDFSNDNHDALLIPRPDGKFNIVVDPIPKTETRLSTDIIRHRNRFRIAHEIAHSFFYDRSKGLPRRTARGTAKEEEFCDEFASALLIPRRVVEVKEPEPASIFDLQHRYDVSAEASARAISRVAPDVTIVGMLWKSHPSTGEGMRVVWSAGPRYLPMDVRLRSSVIDKATTVGEATAVEKLGVGGLRGNFRVMASRPRGRKQLVAVATEASNPVPNSTNCLAVAATLSLEIEDPA